MSLARNLAVLPAANFFFKNRIINGDMRIDQRNSGVAVTPVAAPTYTVDRFMAQASQASKLTYQRVVDAPPGLKFSTKITVAAQLAPAATDFFAFTQGIEGQNIVDLQFGLATAETITAALWIKGSVAGSYSCSIVNASGARCYVGTIAVTTSWARQSITLAADTTGTWATDETAGLFFRVDLGSGSNFNGTAGAWAAGNFRRTSGSVTFVNQAPGATLNITGVQLERGSLATPFEVRPIGTELAMCQRYYQVLGKDVNNEFNVFAYSNTGGGSVIFVFPLIQEMRGTPVVTRVGSWTASNTAGQPVITGASKQRFTISAASTVVGMVQFNNSTAASMYVTADAEL